MNRPLAAVSLVIIAGLVLSGIRPYDRTTWILEVFPVVVALPLLWATRERFPLTTLLYTLIALHAVVLMVGGAYSYARVPLGFSMQEAFGLSRNPYDRIGHFMQGFVPAILSREILVRGGYVRGRRMLAFICICIPLAFSAFYELVEWWAALSLGQGADEFLGTQGDQWDTQSDMFCALIGGVVALVTLSRLHDRQLMRFRASA